MKTYRIDALFGKQRMGYVIDKGDDLTLVGASGAGCELKAAVRWPDQDFSASEAVGREARGGLIRRIVKWVLSKKTGAEFTAAYTEMLRFFTALDSSMECSWVQLHLMDCGVVYVDRDGKRQTLAKDRLADHMVADAMLKKSGTAWDDWREVHKANFKACGEECELHRKMMSEGSDMLYPWTKEDAEDCAAFYTDGHWLA